MGKSTSIVEHTQFANMVTRVVIEHEGKYLMVQEGKAHIYGLWAFPGGKVDLGEALTESAVREIREETGIEVELTGILGAQYLLWNDRPGFTFEVAFIGKAIAIPEIFPVSEEVLAVEWKSRAEIEQLAVAGKLRNKGQEAIVRMLLSGATLSISRLVEGDTKLPREARQSVLLPHENGSSL